MKLVKDINRLIIKKIVEIIFVSVFVFFSITLWKSENTKNFFDAISINDFNYTNIDIEKPNNFMLIPMFDENGKNTNPVIVKVFNETYTKESYTLALKINKNSTLDYNCLKIMVDDNIYSLKDLKSEENDNAYIFSLDNDSLRGASKIYKVRFWLNSDTDNGMQEKDLSMEFILINQTGELPK